MAFLGANTYDKGAWTLALAAGELNRKGLPVHVVFAGPNRKDLDGFLSRQPGDVRAALAGTIHILGLVPEDAKHALLSACDMLALPSQVDAFGIVLLEAWQHGKPVIGAAAGGIPDLVAEGETGLLVPFGSAPALAAAIETLLADRALAQQLGANGRDQVSREYTWDHTYSKLEGTTPLLWRLNGTDDLRIAFTIHKFPPESLGGTEIYAWSLARANTAGPRSTHLLPS